MVLPYLAYPAPLLKQRCLLQPLPFDVSSLPGPFPPQPPDSEMLRPQVIIGLHTSTRNYMNYHEFSISAHQLFVLSVHLPFCWPPPLVWPVK